MPEFIHKNQKIEYTLSRNAKKNINIRIKPNGKIYISAPRRVTKTEIDKMISEKAEWIIKNQRKILNKTQNIVKKNIKSGNIIYLNGAQYIIKIISGVQNHVYVHHPILTVQIKENYINSQEYINTYFERWLKENIYSTCDKLIDKYIAKLDTFIIESNYNHLANSQCNYLRKLTNNHLSKPYLTIRTMTSLWGSCTPSKNQITINKNLIYPPKECLEYVILHELSHLLEPNHSKKFYNIIENIMPDWKERKNILNNF